MLDTDTKRRIDTARDILVGKVPDPKSQVEQITIALIYKFMDDMDAEAEELGGSRKFFSGEFARYGWAKLMRSGLGGHETLNLYAEAITKMPENPGIPTLFRDIFKNAYLPYRDPETLRMFLKVIDEFEYDHSERLGDAFEYLLSVLGSQGDAGQFRTPRHIIDFIVAIVDPKKSDAVLDPACGTAGFLISSYKHILRANTGRDGACSLTPDERGRLANNFRGYDISPDMVRLSLVNMYLHGFTDPHIHEYDTLTSQDRWNEYADVILANPPFMSPKGGIKPHNRFSVQSKRSEVLFVDYMAEHLTPNGRAGIIVPEGVIFQSQTAYTQLRKMLVEDYLVAVVSLPAGVFQPYSGVKTSILILDKALAKQTGSIGFFKIESDGFGLGAQRRPIDRDDLPQARTKIAEFLHRLRARESVEVFQPTLGLVVPKETIAASGDYNLSGERYREDAPQSGSYPWHRIEDLVVAVTPPMKLQKASFGTIGRYPIIDQSQNLIAGWTDDEAALVRPSKPMVIFGDHTCAVKLIDEPFVQGADGIKILETVESLDPRFLYYVIRTRPLESVGYQRHFALLKRMEIPLPPMGVQKEVVAEIEGYQKVIDGARAVLDNYRPHIAVDPAWPLAELGNFVSINNGFVLTDLPNTGNIACIKVSDMNLEENQREIVTSSHWLPATDKACLPVGSVVFPKRGAAIATNKKRITRIPCLIDNNCMGLTVRPGANLDPDYLFNFLLGFDLSTISNSAGIALINNGDINSVQIPLPPIETQQAIVAEIEAEQALVGANRELVARMEKKIQATLARVWGEAPQTDGASEAQMDADGVQR